MTMFFGSMLATALVVQVQAGTVQGKVVDDQGKPLADVQVVFFTPADLDLASGSRWSWDEDGRPREDSGSRPRDRSGQLTLDSGRIVRARPSRRRGQLATV